MGEQLLPKIPGIDEGDQKHAQIGLQLENKLWTPVQGDSKGGFRTDSG